MKCLSFGEILWDIYPDKKHLGGAPLNFAAHLAKHGESVYILSALGEDELGNEALTKIQKLNIATDYVSFCKEKQTGKCLVTLDENYVPTYNLLQNVAYDYINCDNLSQEFYVLYFGTLALRSKTNYASLKHLLKNNRFEEIFVDINLRSPFYTAEAVEFSLQSASILKISLEELPTLLEVIGLKNSCNHKKSAKYLAEKYPNVSLVVITLGSDGAYILDCLTFKEYSCNCPEVKVVSTVGAGDSFSAAFLHKYLRGFNIQYCMEYATRIASYVVSEYDAVPNYNIEDFA